MPAHAFAETLARPGRRPSPLVQELGQATPGHIWQRVSAGQIEHRWPDVDQADWDIYPPVLCKPPRPAHDQWHADCTLIMARLPPHAVLAGHVAVIGAVHDDRVLGLGQRPKGVEHPPNVGIQLGHQPIISRQRAAVLLWRQVVYAAPLPPPADGRMQTLQGRLGGQIRCRNPLQVIFEQRSGTDERIVRQHIADHQAVGAR